MLSMHLGVNKATKPEGGAKRSRCSPRLTKLSKFALLAHFAKHLRKFLNYNIAHLRCQVQYFLIFYDFNLVKGVTKAAVATLYARQG